MQFVFFHHLLFDVQKETVLPILSRKEGLETKENPMRLLHTMIRVMDLEASLAFYQKVLGMTMLRKEDYPDGRFTLVFLGYGPEESSTVIELTHNWDQSVPYDMGNAFGHIAIAVPDIYKACEEIKAAGGNVVREPGPMKHGDTVIAFIEDPDGYKVELIQGD